MAVFYIAGPFVRNEKIARKHIGFRLRNTDHKYYRIACLSKIMNAQLLTTSFHLSDEIEEDEAKQHPQQDKCIKEKSLQRKRRIRSHFTQRQLQYLEKIFSRQQYLTRDERTLLARGLEMTELQIRNWFQNKRYQKKHRAISNDTKADKQDKPEKPDTSTCGKADV